VAAAVLFSGSYSFPLGNALMLSHRCERNIFCRANRFVAFDLADAWERALQSCDHNIYFNDDKVIGFYLAGNEVAGLEAWRSKTGFDAHSIAANPLFVAPDKDDFGLRTDSPALRLGFVPIDTGRIGPRVDFRTRNDRHHGRRSPPVRGLSPQPSIGQRGDCQQHGQLEPPIGEAAERLPAAAPRDGRPGELVRVRSLGEG
jgi:hypothetical protein